jgi:hypothetical protein
LPFTINITPNNAQYASANCPEQYNGSSTHKIRIDRFRQLPQSKYGNVLYKLYCKFGKIMATYTSISAAVNPIKRYQAGIVKIIQISLLSICDPYCGISRELVSRYRITGCTQGERPTRPRTAALPSEKKIEV